LTGKEKKMCEEEVLEKAKGHAGDQKKPSKSG